MKPIDEIGKGPIRDEARYEESLDLAKKYAEADANSEDGKLFEV